jgi:hypothetical protein
MHVEVGAGGALWLTRVQSMQAVWHLHLGICQAGQDMEAAA